MYVPTQAELLAKATQLGVDLRTPGARARVAQVINAERTEADAPVPQPPERRHTGPEPILLSRSVSTVDVGQIVVDVHLIPNRTKENSTDVRADQHAEHAPAGAGLPAAECPAGAVPDPAQPVPDAADAHTGR